MYQVDSGLHDQRGRLRDGCGFEHHGPLDASLHLFARGFVVNLAISLAHVKSCRRQPELSLRLEPIYLFVFQTFAHDVLNCFDSNERMGLLADHALNYFTTICIFPLDRLTGYDSIRSSEELR